jgi:hypothetical protein
MQPPIQNIEKLLAKKTCVDVQKYKFGLIFKILKWMMWYEAPSTRQWCLDMDILFYYHSEVSWGVVHHNTVIS